MEIFPLILYLPLLYLYSPFKIVCYSVCKRSKYRYIVLLCDYTGYLKYFLPAVGVVHDGATLEEIVTVNISITVIFVFLAILGIVFTIACLVYNFIFRKQK